MALPSTVQTRAPERAVRRATVCLAGNPNVGKSTLFNALTGAAVETANYAGMTVETTAIQVNWEGQPLEIVDLPGAYALSIGEGEGRTDERVARQALLERRPDVVIAVADATNLARNLYLVLQLLDLGFRVVVALNFMDEARRRDVRIDRMALQEALGVPVVRTVAVRGEGIADVKAAVVEMVRAGATPTPSGRASRRSLSASRRARTRYPMALARPPRPWQFSKATRAWLRQPALNRPRAGCRTTSRPSASALPPSGTPPRALWRTLAPRRARWRRLTRPGVSRQHQ